MIDIIETDDQWVDDGVPEQPGRSRLTDLPAIDTAPEEDEREVLSPLQRDITKWTQGNHGRMDSELGVFVRNYLYEHRLKRIGGN